MSGRRIVCPSCHTSGDVELAGTYHAPDFDEPTWTLECTHCGAVSTPRASSESALAQWETRPENMHGALCTVCGTPEWIIATNSEGVEVRVSSEDYATPHGRLPCGHPAPTPPPPPPTCPVCASPMKSRTRTIEYHDGYHYVDVLACTFCRWETRE